MKRDDILAKAGELINGDRKEDYGDAYLNHMRIAEFWNNYLDHEIKLTPTDVAMMMMLVKIAVHPCLQGRQFHRYVRVCSVSRGDVKCRC